MNKKNLLLIFQSAPYDTPYAQEGLDTLLAAAVFEQNVSVLFVDEGIFQLLSEQQPQGRKNHGKMLQALSMYDVENCFYHKPSAVKRQITNESFSLKATALNNLETHALLASADHTLTF